MHHVKVGVQNLSGKWRKGHFFSLLTTPSPQLNPHPTVRQLLTGLCPYQVLGGKDGKPWCLARFNLSPLQTGTIENVAHVSYFYLTKSSISFSMILLWFPLNMML